MNPLTETKQQYTLTCRLLERANLGILIEGAEEAAEDWRKALATGDLYLWSEEKAKACLDFHKEHIPDFFEIDKVSLPVTHVDHMGSVTILQAHVNADGVLGIEVMVAGFEPDMGERDDAPEELENMGGGFFAHGMVFVQKDEDKGAGQYKMAPQFSFHEPLVIKSDRKTMVFLGEEAPQARLYMEDAVKERLMRDTANAAITAIEQMFYALRPRETVIREVPKKVRKYKGGKHGVIPRAEQREVHVLLDPDEVQEIKRSTGEAEGTHASPRPHTRKAHRRVLRSDRFKNAKGRVIEVGMSLVNVKDGETIETPRKVYHVVRAGA